MDVEGFGDGEDQVRGSRALVSLGLLGPSEAYKSVAYETLVQVNAGMAGIPMRSYSTL